MSPTFPRVTPGPALKVFIALLFSFFLSSEKTLNAQSELVNPPSSTVAGSVQLVAKDVVETAVQDSGFLLTLYDSVPGNARLLQQLQEDYFPLFDQQAIARQILKSRFNSVSNAQREYLECLVGLSFFNAHLDIVSQQSGAQKLFEITDVQLTPGGTRVMRIDVRQTQDNTAVKFIYRLFSRRGSLQWKIVDIHRESGGLLASLRKKLQEIHTSAVNNDVDAYTHAIQYLIRRNSGNIVSATQWCKPVAEDLSDSQASDSSVRSESISPFEVNTTINGQAQNVTLEVTPEGRVIYQDDIILGSDGDVASALSGLDFRQLRLWRDAIVPYLIDDTVSDKEQVLQAIQEWNKKTPVRFVEVGPDDKNWLNFTAGDGCRSSLGMRGGRQFITLSSRCSYGAVLHEIGHTLGLIHEHNRENRDSYIAVKLRNVLYEKEHNFYKHPAGHPVTGDYCYDSIMHYSQHAFSISPELKTIEVKGRHPIGQRTQLSSCDVTRIHKLYSPLLKSSSADDRRRSDDQ